MDWIGIPETLEIIEATEENLNTHLGVGFFRTFNNIKTEYGVTMWSGVLHSNRLQPYVPICKGRTKEDCERIMYYYLLQEFDKAKEKLEDFRSKFKSWEID